MSVIKRFHPPTPLETVPDSTDNTWTNAAMFIHKPTKSGITNGLGYASLKGYSTVKSH